ncbi:MAG TPA: hypothetical protein VJJ24_02060 [Candidatus Paceibacterota bacterium]
MNSNSKTIIWVIVGIIVIVGAFLIIRGDNTAEAPSGDYTNETPQGQDNEPVSDSDDEAVAQTRTVTYTDSGFSPSEITIKRGEKVTFVNSSTHQMWVASAMHPTHTTYPGSDIKLCGTTDVIFDECEGDDPGESWSFPFNIVGSWGYHNHLSASHFGKVIVTE